MSVSTNREISIPSKETTSLTARDHAVSIFYGKEDSLAPYVSLRTFDRSKHPAWLDAICFRLAQSRFEEIPFAKTIGSMMYTAAAQHLSNPVQMWILKNITLERPETVREQWFRGIEELHKKATPRFNEKHYSQIGVPVTGVLHQLTDPDCSDRGQVESENLLEKIDLTAIKFDKDKANEALNLLLDFNPARNSPFGNAAAKAYADIGQAIICYTILSDILEHFDIPLSDRKVSELYSRLLEQPFSLWQNDPVVQNLFAYARALLLNPTLTEHISRKDVFIKFAMTGRPISDLTLEAHRLNERKSSSESVFQGRSGNAESLETTTLLDEMLHSLENLFHEWEIDASAEDLAPLRLARLAVSQKVPFSKLERLLMLHDFDGARVIEEIRPEGRVASSGQSSTVSQERPSQLAASIEPEIPSFKLFIHREGEKEPFNSWYNDLQKSQKNRVHAALKKFVEGHLGNVKKLSTRAKSEADVSAYEIKIKDSGMRLYFRYLPNHRVILLGGGDKHTQERDIPLVMERAAHYNGSNKTLSENLSELDI
jgi:putative addiction module killer protein